MDRYTALLHAVKAHGAALDKCGRLYVLHPIAVAEAVERMEVATELTLDEDCVVAALLHDVWEDTEYGPMLSLNAVQHRALILLTHNTGHESYFEYIAACGKDATATVVKLADLWHNLQPERMDCLPESERRSLERRYLKARQMLWDALGFEWWPK